MTRPKTNVQFVKDLMEHSRYGALSQMFIIDAIGKLADRVSASSPINHPLINGEAWKGVAQEIKQKLEERK